MPDVERPFLTLPEAEAEALAAAYARADVILEYGSGGSTALALDLGKFVLGSPGGGAGGSAGGSIGGGDGGEQVAAPEPPTAPARKRE